ncbi:MAG: copper transporter [Actinomycetota bacterium]
MINLRYHIVSIVAVFLALGIGIAMGTSFIDGVIVQQLENRVADLEADRDEAADEVTRLNEALASAEADENAFEIVASGSLFTRRLDEDPVMIMAADGVDEAAVALARRALASSGADYAGVVTISDAFDLDDPDRREVLGRLLGVSPELAEDGSDPLRDRLSERLGAALLPEAPTPAPIVAGSRLTGIAEAVLADPESPSLPGVSDPFGPGDDVLSDLLAAGFLSYDPAGVVAPDLNRLPRAGSRYLLLGSPEAAEATAEVLGLVLLQLLRSEPAPAVVASTGDGSIEDPFLDRYRGDGSFAGAVSTVDTVGELAGVSAAILALDGIGDFPPGDFGRRDDATALLPFR